MAEAKVTPIAVIGLSCRFPGGANNPEELWELLREGRSAWSDVPSDRWNWKSFYHPSHEFNGTHNHRGGHFLDQDISAFDASFFGIPPTEAKAIDPQQRIQLETAYEALENAGIPLESIRGSKTSVFVAVFSHDYDRFVYKDVADVPQYHTTGAGAAIFSNRISYLFDLKGPSMTIDTGCSGSLVALHQACQSLRYGESNMAIVGGTNLILGPDQMVAMSMLSLLNADGKSYAFDSRGSGYGRGEGVATVILKRLEDALQDSDPVRAIIRNTGVNQDGRTSGITLPSQESQQMLVRSVYKDVGLDPTETPYVEAHGTGTVAGDSIELRALANVFCNNGARVGQLHVGSIKSNIGHLESTSGLAGLIKTVLALERGLIPPNVNLESIKKGLYLEKWKIKIPRSLESWPAAERRRASLNSFGYGGTNAHTILEASSIELYSELSPEAQLTRYRPRQKTSFTNLAQPLSNGENVKRANESKTSPRIFVITAMSENSLLQSVNNLKQWLASGEEDDSRIRDLAFTLSSRRSLMQWRTSVVASTYRDLVTLLQRDLPMNRIVVEPSIAFVFTGQGAQWHGMGRDLIFTHSAFHNSLSKADEILKKLGAPWSVIEELVQNETQSRINQSDIAQPTTTAIQLALIDMLASLGITPTAVVGHSSGEIAAAYAAGILSQEMALRVSYHRGFIANAVKQLVDGNGAMLAVGSGEEEALAYISKVSQGAVNLACVNSPLSTTFSGDEAGIIELQEILNNAAIFNRRLKVDTAYHSHHMQKVADQYLTALEGLEAGVPSKSVKFFSSVSGEEKVSGFGPSYWVDNLVSQVKFSHALTKLSHSQSLISKKSSISHHLTLIEVGAHSALAGPIRQTMTAIPDESVTHSYISCLVRDRNARNTILEVVGKLFNQGAAVNLLAANSFDGWSQTPNVITDLRPYPWDHTTKYWHESRLSREYRLRKHPYHDLLGTRVVTSTSIEPSWRHIISVSDLPWLQEHMIDGSPIFPGSAYLCMAIEAMRQIIQDREITSVVQKFVLKDVSWIKALIIPEASAKVEVQISLRPPPTIMDSTVSITEDFQVTSFSIDGTWNLHCRGTIAAEFMPSREDYEALREQRLADAAYTDKFASMMDSCTQQLSSKDMYNEFKSNGNSYGPKFATINDFHFGSGQVFGEVFVPDVASSMPSGFHQPHLVHPTTLDTLIHSGLPLFYRQHAPASVMPVACREITISADIATGSGQTLIFGTTLTSTGTRSSSADIMVFYQYPRAEQNPVLVIAGLELFGIGETLVPESPFNRSLSHKIEWKADAEFIPADELSSDFIADTQGMTPERKLEVLNQAASIYIDRCLKQVPDESMMSVKHHIDHWKWMKRFYTSDQGKDFVESLTEAETEQILRLAKSAGSEGVLLSRIGPNLASILTGKINSVQFMFEDDSPSRLYAIDDSMLQCYDRMNKYLGLLAFKDPNLVILEVGAGTGGATSALFRGLGRGRESLPIERYDYTDISSGFFEQARDLLNEWTDFLQFKVLDIEHDPTEQGFVEGSYDLIIASNVLHATTSIHNTLSNVRKLLKPGGRLLLIEVTRFTLFYNTCFGILEGWFAGVNDGRIDSPLMSVDQWDVALTQASFSGISITAQDYAGEAHRASMMISKAYERIERLPMVEILSENNSALASRLDARLKELGLGSSATSWHSDPVSKEVVYVILDDSAKPILSNPSTARFTQLVNLVTQGTQILWISVSHAISDVPDPLNELIIGFARTARAENEGLKFVTLTTQENRNGNYINLVEIISEILSISFGAEVKPGLEYEYRYIDDRLLIPRIVPDKIINNRIAAIAGKAEITLAPFIQKERPLKLQERRGLLDSLVFVDDTEAQCELGEDDIEISVKAWGISTEDVKALGQTKIETPLVHEFAGIVTAVGINFKSSFRVGDRVCAWHNCASSQPRTRGYNAYRLPENLSFAEGASIPVAFVTAYYSLICLAHVQEYQKILVHDATGAVGQAAIAIAKQFNAEIFATADSVEKREFLVTTLQIPEDHVFSNNTATFRKAIRRLTRGAGVEVVLNSLTEELLVETWACVAKFGTFIEIGSTDAALRPFDRNTTLASVDMMAMAREQPEKAGRIFQSAMSMFNTKAPPAIQPIILFSLSKIDEAFRLVQSRKSIGKVVLEADSSTLVKVVSAKPAELSLDRGSSYIVAGGLGYIGRHICRFMASHGATNIIISTRRRVDDVDNKAFQEEILELGAKVCIVDADLRNSTQVHEFVSRCGVKFPPLKGIVQAAVSYQDRPLEQMTLEEFKGALEPKVNGTLNLSNAVSELELDFFIMLSSVVAVLGNKAQANYAAGNTFQDALAHSNSASKTHYFSLNLGLVEGGSDAVGTQNLIRQGCIPLELEHLFISLAYAMCGQARKDNCNQVVLGFDRRSISSQENNTVLRDPLFNLLPRLDNKSKPTDNKGDSQTVEEAIASAKKLEEVNDIIATAISKRLAALVAMDVDKLDLESPLIDFGLDSLIAIELRNWISRTFDTVLQTTEIFDSPNILTLTGLVCERSTLVTGRFS